MFKVFHIFTLVNKNNLRRRSWQEIHGFALTSSSINTLLLKQPLQKKHTQVKLHTMESRETSGVLLVEDNVDIAVDVSDSGGKETGEKRKKEELEDLDKSHRGKKRRGKGSKSLRPGERYIPPPQKRNQGVSFNHEHFQETSYYFEGGLRKVYPYFFDFKAYCKGRWIGKSISEVFSSEFRVEPLDYYQAAAKEGRIRLNETPIDDLSIILRNNDFLRNTVHRHEPPVSGKPLEILEDNGEVLVVDKPASMPVHPCGRFRHNSVIFILGKERGITGIHTVHRLDRLTSGVLLFARTLEVSQKLDQMVRERQVEKEYVCRVKGEFPEGDVVCEEPILVVSFKVGLCRVHPNGKESRTVFQRLSWNGQSSVVRCLPVTGRTHQIRVHLQFLGHPILNDPIYGSSAWGPEGAKGGLVGMSNEQLLEALMEEHRSQESLHLLDIPGGDILGKSASSGGVNGNSASKDDPLNVSSSHETKTTSCTEGSQGQEVVLPVFDCTVSDKSLSPNETSGAVFPAQDSSNGTSAGHSNGPSSSTDNDKETVTPKESQQSFRDPLCSECKIVRRDPTEKELVMYLHALRYKGPDFEYSTRTPAWAQEDWIEE